MKPLYLAAPVHRHLGNCLRPGGAVLTERIVKLVAPESGSVVLDAGCGPGASLAFLRQKGMGSLIGFDLDLGLLQKARQSGIRTARADLAFLPLADACIDMILSECVWNLTDRVKVTAEFFRVLRVGGCLAITDIYLRGDLNGSGSWPVQSCFSQATDLKHVAEFITAAGFDIIVLEDHTSLLNQTAAEFVFAHGSLFDFWQAVTGSRERAHSACLVSKKSRPGLFLLIVRKTRHEQQ